MKIYQVFNKRLGTLFSLDGNQYNTNDYTEAIQVRNLLRDILEDTGRNDYTADVVIIDAKTKEEII